MRVLEFGESFFPIKVKCEQITDEYGFTYGDKKDFCGALLEVEMTDLRAKYWDKYPNYRGVDYGVECPVCKKFIPITNLPAYIIERIEKK